MRGFLLTGTIGRARRRLQFERFAKGSAIVVGGLLLASLLSTFVLARYNFSDAALFWTRLVGFLGLLSLSVYYIVLPLIRIPTVRQVARFLEERHPQLQERLSTAVEIETATAQVDAGMQRLITRDARKHVAKLSEPRLYYPRRSFTSLALVFSCLLIFSFLFLRGPEVYPYSLKMLIHSLSDQAQPAPYFIEVTPGSLTVGKHTDLEVRARLRGFNAQKVHLSAKYENEPQWEEVSMRPDPNGEEFVFVFFDIRDRLDYYVEAEGVRSDTYTIQISEIPRVEELRVLLRFPAYTGLQNVMQEDEGDIRALVGTTAEISIRTDQPVKDGTVKLGSSLEVPLAKQGDRQLHGTLKIRQDNNYTIHLQDMQGVWNPASDEYVIEALQDQPPVLTFTRPGRDQKVTNIQEAFTELRAEDDYGVLRWKLRFSVNGLEEQEVDLDYPRGSRSSSTSHTFYLEEFDLQPGDFVSYYSEASDAASTSLTDIYFFEVQPYDLEFYQSQQGLPMGGTPENDLLSKRQKEIIAGTFNLERHRDRYSQSEFLENSQTLALVQQRLEKEARTILERLERRGALGMDRRFQKMGEHLRLAITHMEPAHQQLNQQNTKGALPEEQKAFQQLLRAESLFRQIMVSFSQNQAGGVSAEQLADLIDLELDRTKNQYETLQQNRELNSQQALDETLEKLKELAKRQQQLVERNRRKAAAPSHSSGSNANQQELIEETQRLLRQLERLSRQKPDPKTQEISRELRQALRNMRQAQSGSGTSPQSQMRAQQALERLKKAEAALRDQQWSRLQERLQNLGKESQRIVQEQKRIVQEIEKLKGGLKSERLERKYLRAMRPLVNKKSQLQSDLQGLEGELHQTARQMGSKHPESSRKLKGAAVDIRDERLTEKMREGSEFLLRGWKGLARERERELVNDLQELADKIREAGESFGPEEQLTPDESLEQVLNRLGTFLEGLESLQERAANANQSRTEGKQAEEEQQSAGQEPKGNGGSTQEQSPSPNAEEQRSVGRDGGRNSSLEGSARRSGVMPNLSGINPRQVGSEWRERLQDAHALRRLLEDHPELMGDVARLIRRMRRIEAENLFSDPEEVARLKSGIIDGFRQLELEISRALHNEALGLLRSVNREEVPPEFREQVDEYYRSLAGRKKR